MGAESHFTHRCRIERGEGDGPDGYRQTRTVPRVVASGLPCRLIEKSRTFVSTETAQLVTAATYKLLVPVETDVQVGDSVSEIVLEGGEEMGVDFLVATLVKRRNRGAGQFLSADLKGST